VSDDNFMLLELRANALHGVKGIIKYNNAFSESLEDQEKPE
jgi:predicted N-acetyltransferase YhbS